MTEELLTAIIAAVASLVVAIVSVLATARTNRRVASLTEELEEQRAVRDARRDYEHEARKRLYAECEPLLFEAAELAERARSRILSIARTCRQGDLCPDAGWLAGPGIGVQAGQGGPGRPDRDELLRQAPRVYRRQGLYLGTLETATEAMVKESGDAVVREPVTVAHGYLQKRVAG